MSAKVLMLPSIAAITVFLIYMVVVQFAGRKETVKERVRRMVDNSVPEESTESSVSALYAEQELSPLGQVLNSILRMMGINTDEFRKNSQLLFYRAGVGSPNAPIIYLFFKRIGVVIFVLIALRVATLRGDGMVAMMHYIIAIVLAVLGIWGPDLYLKNKRQKRELQLNRAFPDTLDLLLACVESGLALDGALMRVCRELVHAYPEITQELNRTRLELTLLNDRSQALINLAERTNLAIFRLLTTTLLQSERFGTSLTDTLRVLSEDSRNTRLMLAEERAGRLPVLMTIPLITMLLPALFLIILGPTIINVMDTVHHMRQ